MGSILSPILSAACESFNEPTAGSAFYFEISKGLSIGLNALAIGTLKLNLELD